MTATVGARRASQTSIVLRAPSRFTRLPLWIPKAAKPTASAPMTTLVRVAEPVVVRTNQGRASQVICAPVTEITCAPSSALMGRLFSMFVWVAARRTRGEHECRRSLR